MDSIFNLDSIPWISQRKIKISDLIKERECDLQQNNTDLRFDDGDENILRELNEFAKSGENEINTHFLFNSTDERSLLVKSECNLETYRLHLEHAKKVISDRAYKYNYLTNLKTTRREMLMRHLAQTKRSSQIDGHTSTEGLVAIVVIQLWSQPKKTEKVKLEREILFRSDQKLTLLREHVRCPRDFEVPIDLSSNPEQARVFRGEMYKSGCLFINDTFYNDMRNPNNNDLSSEIIDWASREVIIRGPDGRNKRVDRGIGSLSSAKMEEYSFEDLEFRLGCPYLYLHQGDCEHLFTISDIRYVLRDTSMVDSGFPLVTATAISGKAQNLRCFMCQSRPPHWYTRDNTRLPVDPFFFCETCFHSFNYDANKMKIGNFRAYLYTSSHGIPSSVNIETN